MGCYDDVVIRIFFDNLIAANSNSNVFQMTAQDLDDLYDDLCVRFPNFHTPTIKGETNRRMLIMRSAAGSGYPLEITVTEGRRMQAQPEKRSWFLCWFIGVMLVGLVGTVAALVIGAPDSWSCIGECNML